MINDTEKEFRWQGKLGISGIFNGEHYFILNPINEHSTELIQGENFKRILSGALFPIISKDTKNGFESMNLALKNISEQ